MNRLKLTLTVALIASSTLAMAEQMSSDSSREQRMDTALQDYRSKQVDTQPGPAARTEESIKRGAHKARHAIEHGAKATGDAVKKGVHKTGEVMERAGEKMEGATSPKP